MIGKALIENPGYILEKHDIDILFSDNSNPKEFNLMEKLYTDLFFLPKEAAFADSFRSNVRFLNKLYKECLALAVVKKSKHDPKSNNGTFCLHTAIGVSAVDPTRIKRNRSLIRPLKDLFMDLLPEYNAAVFDNQKENESYNKNILDLLVQLNNIDLVYFDPPYCNSHADYQALSIIC